MSKNNGFRTEEDSRKRNRLLGLAYGGYVPFVFLTQTLLSPLQYAIKFAVVSALSLMPYAAEKTFGKKLAPVFNKLAGVDNVGPAPEDLREDVESLCRKAGISKKIDPYVFGGENSVGACASMGAVYFSRGSNEKLNREERKFVLAHELSHINTEDENDKAAFNPAVLNALADSLMTFTVFAPANGAEVVTSAAALLLSVAFYEYQDMLQKKATRDIEYRADRNAIKLTRDFKSAATALVKMQPSLLSEMSSLKQIFSPHPLGMDRLRALESAANGGKPTYCMDAALELVQRSRRAVQQHPHPERFIEQAYELTDGGTKPAPQFL